MSSRATRVSPLRVLVVAATAIAVVGAVVAAERPLLSPVAAVPAPVFSPYVDVTATPPYQFQTPASTVQQNVTLAFVVASRTQPCSPSWGGAYSLAEADSQLQLGRRIAQLRATGGQARVSFGGQANQDLADACTDASSLLAAYTSVVDAYDLTSIDLDVEGAALDDTAGIARRAQAIARLQSTRPADQKLAVWLTLPLGRDGLTATGRNAVAAMLHAGVDLAGVNGMAFDFGSTAAGGMAATIQDATNALHDQVRTLFGDAGTNVDSASAWARTGVTVMIGQSDVAGERLTIADARSVNSFTTSVGIGQVSMWSLNRDSTCTYPLPTEVPVVQTSCSGVDQGGQSFAQVLGDGLRPPPAFVEATASPTASASETPDAQATDDPATSPFPVWDPLAVYVTGMKVVWHRQVYQAAFYSTGVPPDTGSTPNGGDPWRLIGPVLPGESPAPAPSLPVGTYPQWFGTKAYVAGDKVLVGTVPYVARYWTKGDRPGTPVVGGNPWTMITTSS